MGWIRSVESGVNWRQRVLTCGCPGFAGDRLLTGGVVAKSGGARCGWGARLRGAGEDGRSPWAMVVHGPASWARSRRRWSAPVEAAGSKCPWFLRACACSAVRGTNKTPFVARRAGGSSPCGRAWDRPSLAEGSMLPNRKTPEPRGLRLSASPRAPAFCISRAFTCCRRGARYRRGVRPPSGEVIACCRQGGLAPLGSPPTATCASLAPRLSRSGCPTHR